MLVRMLYKAPNAEFFWPQQVDTLGDSDGEVQVTFFQMVEGYLLQASSLQLRQALDGYRPQPDALAQHGRPRVVTLGGGGGKQQG